MKKRYNGQSRFGRFLRGNVAYVSLAIALLAVGAIGVVRIIGQEKPPTSLPDEEMVEQNVIGEPDDRTTTPTTDTTAQKTTTTTTAPEEETPDLYVLPLSNTVQKPFSADAPLYSETMTNWRLHLGTDFAGEIGQEVKALARGTVKAVEQDPLWGNVIVIDHSMGVESRYCGVKALVKEGQQVDVTDVIGTLSEIPCEAVQEPHLHLEMTVDGAPVDPVEAIGLEVRYADSLDE